MHDQDLNVVIIFYKFSPVLLVLASLSEGFKEVFLTKGICTLNEFVFQDVKKGTVSPKLVNHILSLGKHFECFSSFIHDQGAVGFYDFLDKDLDWILCFSDFLLEYSHLFVFSMNILQLPFSYDISVFQSFFEQLLILSNFMRISDI